MTRLVFCILLMLVGSGTAGSSSEETTAVSPQHDIDRLLAMAAHHRDLQQFPEASARLTEALVAAHRTHGVHTLEQLPILDQLFAVHMADRQFAQADVVQSFRYWLLSHHYDQDDTTMLDATYRMAQWHLFRERPLDAVFTLEEGIEVIEIQLAQSDAGKLGSRHRQFLRAADEASLLMFGR